MQNRIRLNMIVKNEAHVILRCLASVKPWIDSWCIVDTGSTDGTQQIIQDYLKDIPGKLYERPWKNFGYNRTEALELAVGDALDETDYLLFIDADEQLQAEPNFEIPKLTGDAYYFSVIYGGLRYRRNAMVSARLTWSWKGVLHEYLQAEQPHKWQTLTGLNIFVKHDGARAKNADTYLKDIALLEQGLKDEPDNLRYMFYLAQSYRDAGLKEKSREFYLKRAAAQGWEEERWMARFRAAQLAELMGMDELIIYREYLQCWIIKQHRAEPLYELARYYRNKKDFDLACYFAAQAVEIPLPAEGLFIDASVYQCRALDELSVSASYCQAYRAAGKAAITKLFDEQNFPESQRQRLLDNQKFYQ